MQVKLQTFGKTYWPIPFSIILFRCLLAVILAAHGWARISAGAVAPFGSFLDDQGFPFGLILAWLITVFEIAGTPLFALGRFVPLLAGLYAAVYAVGILLVHAPEGWFVVGLGRNGMEYSVLLISCLLLIGVWHMSPRASAVHTDSVKDTDN